MVSTYTNNYQASVFCLSEVDCRKRKNYSAAESAELWAVSNLGVETVAVGPSGNITLLDVRMFASTKTIEIGIRRGNRS